MNQLWLPTSLKKVIIVNSGSEREPPEGDQLLMMIARFRLTYD